MKPLVYIAAPYSTGDQVANARRAIVFGEWVWSTGLMVPLIPHLTIAWHLVSPHPVEFWYEYDLELLQRCDALFRLDGESSGANAEFRAALELGIPCFTHVTGLTDWAQRFDFGL